MKKFILAGGILGFLIIFWDYDFFLNMGGPETPVTDFITSAFSFNQCCFEAFKFASSIMIFIGLISGFLSWSVFEIVKKIKR